MTAAHIGDETILGWARWADDLEARKAVESALPIPAVSTYRYSLPGRAVDLELSMPVGLGSAELEEIEAFLALVVRSNRRRMPVPNEDFLVPLPPRVEVADGEDS